MFQEIFQSSGPSSLLFAVQPCFDVSLLLRCFIDPFISHSITCFMNSYTLKITALVWPCIVLFNPVCSSLLSRLSPAVRYDCYSICRVYAIYTSLSPLTYCTSWASARWKQFYELALSMHHLVYVKIFGNESFLLSEMEGNF
jgi:hypothetical protein